MIHSRPCRPGNWAQLAGVNVSPSALLWQTSCSRGATDIEQILAAWQADADDQRQRQLAAIRYYLRDLIAECESRWAYRTRGVSNYGTILDQIRSEPKVSLVTFNYDTLIERALSDLGVQVRSMDDYLADDRFELFKLQGSIDWVQWASFKGRGAVPSWKSPEEIIHNAPELKLIQKFGRYAEGSLPTVLQDRSQFTVGRAVPLVPALAVPAVGKSDFICPKTHLESLRAAIPQVTKILIVGWRASEQHFLALLAQGLTETTVKVLAVGRGADGAKETLQALENAGIKGDFQADPGGFSDFVVKNRVEAFLAS